MNTWEKRAMRLITFLGTGSYEETVYRYREDTAGPTRYAARALCELLAVDEVVVLCTEAAEKRHGGPLRDELAAFGVEAVEARRIPPGHAEAELWEQYRALQEAIRTAPGPVVLDITHGFRSQPFFAAAVVVLLRMAGALPGALSIVYCAFDAKDGATGIAPVWELDPFLDLVEWAYGAAVFTATGHAEALLGVLEQKERGVRQALASAGARRFPHTAHLVKAVRRFANDLATVRVPMLVAGVPREAGSSARALREAVTGYAQEVHEHLPAFEPLLDALRKMTEGLDAPTLAGPEGERALATLARLYLRLARYPEAAAVLREAWVTRYADAPAGTEAGTRDFDPAVRAEAERRWVQAEDDAARDVAAVRNDIEHAGFARQPKPAERLAAQLQRLVEEFRPGVSPRDPPRGRTWLVTRHPGAREWLLRQGITADEVVEHLDVDRVGAGDTVVGTLPVHLAARVCRAGARYLHLVLDLPPGRRGTELTADELDALGARLAAFDVRGAGPAGA